ncbi:hypoxia up-regulated protein 1-like [Choristoneura fumiferana]|uniref:hypoxia up-regulated protein 1-like n=1 Tax=Choristoneura fumiferana TaxID=7141 RepID=UPI003D1569F6
MPRKKKDSIFRPEQEQEQDQEHRDEEDEEEYASATPRISFTDLEKSMTSFSGDDAYGIETWITEFEDIASLMEWSDLEKLIYSKRLLSGSARLFLRSLRGITRWSVLKTELREEFCSTLNSAALHKRLASRKMKTNETYQQYFLHMKEIALLGSIEDEALMEYSTECQSNEKQQLTIQVKDKDCSVAPYKDVHINNVSMKALIDTGSDVNLIKESYVDKIKHKNYNKDSVLCLKGIADYKIQTKGSFLASIQIDDCYFDTTISVVDDDAIPVNVILVQVSRAELEELCSDLWARVSSVLSRAAAAGGASASARLVLAGGAARAPAVLAALKDQGYEPSRSINADEAVAMGAVYRAASLATGYKVAALNVKDAVLFPIQVVFTRHVDGADKLIKRTLFSPMNPYPQKKVITFNKHTDDFSFHVNYAELDHIPPTELLNIGSLNLTQVVLTGVGAALNKHTGDNVEHKGIKAHFNMDDSGVLNLVNVEFVAEKTVTEEEDKDSTLSKLGSTISKLFGSDSETPEKPEEKPEEKAPETEKNDTAKANETTAEKQNATDSDSKPKPKVVVLKEPIKTDEQVLVLQPLSSDQFKTSKAKISELDTIDRKRAERESALNTLEAFVVDAQMKMDMEEFAECGTPEEIEEVRKLCSETSEWLYDDGYEAPTEMYEEKLAVIKEKTNPIFYKHWEHRERPDAVAALRSMLNTSNEFLKSAKNFTPEVNPEKDMFTQVEITVLEKKIDETKSWLDKSIKEQDELKKNEEIKLTIDSIREKMANLDREVKYLVNKMKIWRPKKPVKKETDNKTEETIIEGKEGEKVEETQEEKPATEEIPEQEKQTEDSGGETSEVPQLADGNDEHSEL